MELRVKKLTQGASIPAYGTDGAACFDLYVDASEWNMNARAFGVDVSPGSSAVFSTGLAFEVPVDHVMLIFSRSGHGFKNDVRLANCVGVIDSDYRGEVMVKLTCDGPSSLRINEGDRIAQAMLVPVPEIHFVLVDELSDTPRGANGFGSTGK